jgi:hypothetical protein
MGRLEVHAQVSRALAKLTDAQLAGALTTATRLGTGIGGAVAVMEVEGAEVFVKTVRLTDLERAAENVHSTANLCGLPLCYQYGVSSAGFGAWRELAAHLLTTGWVTSGASAAFPLLHHWRVLPSSPTASPDLERQVAAWGGSPAIRARLTAMAQASASVVLFLERFPHDLRTWLGAAREVPGWVERELLAVTSFLGARDFLHFDLHFQNVLTDGQHLFVSDFGQALSSTFTLGADETTFLERHRDFDRSYVVTKLYNFTGDPRHAAIAAMMNGFFAKLRAGDKAAPFPEAELARGWAARRDVDAHQVEVDR